MNTPGTLVIIGGPTASGKTAVAVELAKRYRTDVISADSRQFYHAMRIGTARPTTEELQDVPHHFLGHLDLTDAWSAGDFARAAEEVLQRLLRDHGMAILVGGSGLYIDALIKGLDTMPTSDAMVRERLQARIHHGGIATLLDELKERDPTTWARIDHNNPHRILRALEVCMVTGAPYSALRSAPKDRTDIRLVKIAMHVPRPLLYERINARVDRMCELGLVDEVRNLIPYRHLNALRTVGYTELFRHFDGELSLDDAIAMIKQHSRNYAKRQVTWLRREADQHWVAPGDSEQMHELIRG